LQIENNFRGAKNAGKMPLLEAGLHYKEYALAPKELDFLNSRRWTQEEIVNSYGQTLALYDKNTTRANSETALYLWMAHTISPRQRIVEQKLNETFVKLYDPNLFVAFDECVPENVEFKLQERKTYIETGFMTINELRAEDGLDPVAWGDEPMNRMPAMTPPVPGEEEDEEDPEKSVKKKTSSQARIAELKRGMPTSRPLSR
jgi:HK97 family phage portal protein